MDLLYKIWAFFGFLAFIQIGCIHAGSIRMRRRERSECNDLHTERSSVKDDMAKILTPYVGQEISLDFYDGEEDMDLFSIDDEGESNLFGIGSKQSRAILMDVDSKWALIRIETPKAHKEKLIRISSIKGISIQN